MSGREQYITIILVFAAIVMLIVGGVLFEVGL